MPAKRIQGLVGSAGSIVRSERRSSSASEMPSRRASLFAASYSSSDRLIWVRTMVMAVCQEVLSDTGSSVVSSASSQAALLDEWMDGTTAPMVVGAVPARARSARRRIGGVAMPARPAAAPRRAGSEARLSGAGRSRAGAGRDRLCRDADAVLRRPDQHFVVTLVELEGSGRIHRRGSGTALRGPAAAEPSARGAGAEDGRFHAARHLSRQEHGPPGARWSRQAGRR